MDIYDEECIQGDPATPKDFLQHDAELAEAQRQAFRKAVKMGVKLTFGTDAGICPHGTNARQFAFMVRCVIGSNTPRKAHKQNSCTGAGNCGVANVEKQR